MVGLRRFLKVFVMRGVLEGVGMAIQNKFCLYQRHLEPKANSEPYPAGQADR